MPAQGNDVLVVNLEQNLDTEGAKAAGGLEQVAGAFDKVGASGAAAGGLEQKVAAIGTASKAVSYGPRSAPSRVRPSGSSRSRATRAGTSARRARCTA